MHVSKIVLWIFHDWFVVANAQQALLVLTSCLTQNHPSKRSLFGCCLSCLCQVSISNLTAIPGMQSLTLRPCKHSPIFLIIIRISVTRRTATIDALQFGMIPMAQQKIVCHACYLSESGFFYTKRPTGDCSQSVHFVGKISITTDFFLNFLCPELPNQRYRTGIDFVW